MQQSLFNSREFSDIQLKLIQSDGKERIIYAHKAILANDNPFFRALFLSNFRESRANIVNITVPDIDIALKLIEWMYSKEPFIPTNAGELAQAWLIVEQEKEIPYPGVKAKFILIQDTEESGSIVRELGYRSVIDNSSIKSFELLKYSDGDIRIIYRFSRRDTDLQQYLEHYGISLGRYELHIGGNLAYFGQIEKTKTITKLIIVNNSFSPTEIERINQFFDNKLD